jgi:O-antigen/teichoic acid export membrane protein
VAGESPLGVAHQAAAAGQGRAKEDLFVVLARRLVYVALVFLPLLRYRVGKALDLSDAIFLIAAILLILSRKPPSKAPPAPAWYFGSFVWILAGIVASAQAVSKSASLEVVLNAVFVFFVLQWMLRQLLDCTERIQTGVIAFVLGSSVSAFVAFLQTEFHAFGYNSQASLEGSRAVGLSTQPNIAAVSFALALVFAIGLVVELGIRRRWYLAVCIAVLASALIFSASVSGMSSTLVGCFVLFITRGFRLRTVLGVIAALAIVYAIAVGIQSGGSHFDLNPVARIEQTTGTNTGYNTVNPRVATIEHSWGGIAESPIIGHGLDQTTIAVYYDPDLGVSYPAHNIVILYWFAGGIFLVIALALMMGSSFNRLLHGRLRRPKDRDRAMRDTVLAGSVTVVFFSMQSPELVDRWLWLPFILALCFRDVAVREPEPAATAEDAMSGLVVSPLPARRAVISTPVPRRARGRVGAARHAARSRRVSASARRVMVLTVADQGASSLSNFALALIVAHYSSASALGIFAILTTTYVLSQGLVRSMSSDCLLTRSESDDVLRATYERAGYLAAIVLSVSLAVLVVAISGLLPSAFTLPFVIFAVSFPLLACQDFARYIGISRYDPAYAIRLDLAWLVLFLVAYAVLRHAGLTTLPWVFGAWSGTGALVGLWTLRAHLARAGRRRLLGFWDESERGVGLRFAGQFMLATSSTYLISYLLLFVLPLASIGEFKLSQLALGPITVLLVGLQSALIALAAKRFQVDTARALRFLALGAIGAFGLTLAWTALVCAVPVHTMTAVLGRSWPRARGIVPYAGLGVALSSVAGAAIAGLRAMRAASENLRLAVVVVPFLFVLSMGGAKFYGTEGAAGGLAVAAAVYSVLAWWLLVRVARGFVPGASEVVPDAVVEMAEP